MDAPEKIWAWEIDHETIPPNGYYATDEVDESTEYTRTDRANELVAAAYEDASDEVAMEWANEDMPCEGVGEHLRQTILNLTPADAVAALAARDARIREAALREAVECAKTRQRMLGQVSTEAALALLDALPDAIEALIAKDKANG